jgi:large subunit ribosomal protein L30
MATAKTEDTKVKNSAKTKVAAPAKVKAAAPVKAKAETKVKVISAAMIKVTLVRSVIGRIEAHKATVKGLGLRRMHHTVTVQDTPEIRGMINAVNYLLKVEA